MRLEKIKKQAKLYSLLALGAVLALLGYEALEMIRFIQSGGEGFVSPRRLLLSLPITLFMVLTLAHALLMLRSVARADSPFNGGNVRHLQWIGWLFLLYEPLTWVTNQLFRSLYPISLGSATYVSFNIHYGGTFFVSGLVILAVANIFRYGVQLQTLSDETL